MKRHLLASVAALLLATAVAGVQAAAPVVGIIFSASADKSSFVVKAPDVEATVTVTPDTKFALNEGASDFAKAIVVGNEVRVITNDKDQAFIVLASTVPVRGTVKSYGPDGVVLTTKTGDVTVKTNKDTTYSLNKESSTAELALAAGNNVTINTGDGGIASEVIARSARNAATGKPAGEGAKGAMSGDTPSGTGAATKPAKPRRKEEDDD